MFLAGLLESIIIVIQISLKTVYALTVYAFSSFYAELVQVPVSEQILANLQCSMFTEGPWQLTWQLEDADFWT